MKFSIKDFPSKCVAKSAVSCGLFCVVYIVKSR